MKPSTGPAAVAIRFSIPAMAQACAMVDALKAAAIPAQLSYRESRWIVDTDSTCLVHANKLLQLIYAGKEARKKAR